MNGPDIQFKWRRRWLAGGFRCDHTPFAMKVKSIAGRGTASVVIRDENAVLEPLKARFTCNNLLGSNEAKQWCEYMAKSYLVFRDRADSLKGESK